MSFHEKKTLTNEDSPIRTDVETMARIELSDIDFLLKKIEKGMEYQLERICYETIITKLSAVFQLVMKALQYLEQDTELKGLIKRYKNKNSTLGKIKKFRDDLFHNGISFIQKEIIYPFGRVKGQGFIAIRIHKGGVLRIVGVTELGDAKVEYVITSEGVFEVHNTGKSSEEWISLDKIPKLTVVVNYDDILEVISSAQTELKEVWFKISSIRKQGDGTYEYTYLNEGGKWELFEKGEETITEFSSKSTIHVKGDLTITPPNIILAK